MGSRILILYQFESHYNLLSSLMENLKKHQIHVDVFNVMTWKLSSSQLVRHNKYSYLTGIALGIPKLRGIIFRLFRDRKILSIVRNYDIIDIHSFNNIYFDLLPRIKKINKTIKVTFWGSDLYMADNRTVTMQTYLSKYVDCFQVATASMRNDFLIRFPDLIDKIRVGHFGMEKFDIIDSLQSSSDIETFKHQFKIPKDKIIVTCGYNGSSRQQHLEIIKSIKSLPETIKERAFFLFPMTYGGNKQYLKLIQHTLKGGEVTYGILTKKMTDYDISKIRLTTDILINIQKSDAFSASMNEHLYAGNIVLVGDWLPYEFFFSNGVYLIESSLSRLGNVIEEIITGYSFHKAKCTNNKKKLDEISSWAGSIQDWVSIYRELLPREESRGPLPVWDQHNGPDITPET